MTYEQFFLVNKSLGYYVDSSAYDSYLMGRGITPNITESATSGVVPNANQGDSSHLADTWTRDDGLVVFGD